RSGHAGEVPGRVGDSPLIGCGLFVDGDVGGAGATGKGEECVRVLGSHVIVEAMRRGAGPEDACREALQRIVRNYAHDRQLLREVRMTFYALSCTGEHSAISLWSQPGANGEPVGVRYALDDGTGARMVSGGYLLE